MYKYVAVEKDTPDVRRVWGTGNTNVEAKLQCEIALREKLLGKLKAGCSVGFINTDRYVILSENEFQTIAKTIS